MKRLLLAASLAVLCLTSSAAFAYDDDDDDYRGRHHHSHHDHYYDHDRDYHDDHHHHPGKHKGWKRKHYRRGERIEIVHVERRYYVDHEHYHLRPPPRGHRWIRTDDGKFILVAVATGIIADILLHH